MSVIQGILLATLYYFANSTWGLGVGWWTVMRPLVLGFLVGIILGDPVQGTIIGAQINILYLGFIGAGGAIPSDIALAGVVGTTFALVGNLDTNTALALAVPIGILGTLIWTSKLTLNIVGVRIAENLINKYGTQYYWIANVLFPQLYLFIVSFISCFVIVYFGSSYIQPILDFLGENVLAILNIIGGMLPAVGLALTLNAIYKGEARVFFFLGFLLTQYMQLDMISLGFLSIVITLLYMQLKNTSETEKEYIASETSTEIESTSYALLDKKTVFKSWFNWIMFNQSNYNYERMQGMGYAHAMRPVIKKLYPDDTDKQSERMNLHMAFFNTEPQWGAAIIGLGAAFEEKKAQGLENMEDDSITSIKSGLMGPIAGIGDTINGGVITPILLSFFIGIATQGNLIGPIGYMIAAAVTMWAIYWYSYKLGYVRGSDAIVSLLESGRLDTFLLGASILGCTVLGGLVGNFVNVSTAISFDFGGDEPFLLQTELFDVILPGILPLALTMLCYWLISKKGISSSKIILILIGIGIIGGLTGILAA